MSADETVSRAGLLRAAGGFRWLWLSRMISFTGIGASQVALVLVAARSGPAAVSGVLLANVVPRLLGPLAGAVADRVDQRWLLGWCEAAQGAVFAVIAVTRPGGLALLGLVAAAGLAATFFAPAGKSSAVRLVPADRIASANALLGMAFNLQSVAGPVAGGLLAGLAGPAAAFGATAVGFFASAVLLTRLGPLPPERPGPAAGPGLWPGLAAQTWQGLRYVTSARVPRALVTGTAVFVAFAAMDNVALVFLVERDMRASGSAYGAVVAAYGAGMLAASLLLSRWADRRTAGTWLRAGILAGVIGAAGTAAAVSLPMAGIAQAVAGAGNTVDLVASDTLIARAVPAQVRGRVFGATASAAQAGSGTALVIGGWLVALAGPRVTYLIAGAGMLAGLLVFRPVLAAGRAESR